MQTIKLSQLKEVLTQVNLLTTTIYSPKYNFTISIMFDDLVRLVRIEDRPTGIVVIDCNYNTTAVTWDTEVPVMVTYTTQHTFVPELV